MLIITFGWKRGKRQNDKIQSRNCNEKFRTYTNKDFNCPHLEIVFAFFRFYLTEKEMISHSQ